MTSTSKKNITIAGTGLVGSLLSIYMAKRGYNVSLFERRNDMRKTSMQAGRSINLALSDRGLLALDKIGLSNDIKQIAIPMHGRFIHQANGNTAWQPYGKQGQCIYSVSRGTLNMKLMDLAEKAGVAIHFNHTCKQVNWKTNQVVFETEQGKETDVAFDVLFGADGAFSATRLQHQLQHPKFDYHQYYIDCGYKELTIPPTADGKFALEVNALHIWPRDHYMLIALPNLDKTFTCTLFFPFEGEKSFAALQTPQQVEAFFAETFPDVVPLMPHLTQEFFDNPTSSLVTVKCYPWIREDKFALIGDAAHAIVPFFGQGMNCGFEDCRVLNDLLDEHNDNWLTVFDQYQQSRKPDADAIADLAVNNFVEMREKTGKAEFLFQKKIEGLLHEKYPDLWIPAYSQVTFSPHIRYSEALKNGNIQDAIMREVMQLQNIEDVWHTEPVLNKIKELKTSLGAIAS